MSALRASPPVRSGVGMQVAPESRIPLRDQIAVQVAAGLRSRAFGPGDRLPSSRALSRRLGIHRGTVRAAYRTLAGRGLVTIRPGSGVYVSEPAPDAFRAFLAAERAAGRAFSDVGRLMERWRRAVSARHVTVVGTDTGLRELWTAELASALEPAGVAVSHLPPSVVRDEPARAGRSVLAGPVGAMDGLEGHLPRWAETVVLRPGPSRQLRRLLLQLPVGAVLAAVTCSDALLRQIRELAACLRGEGVAVTGAAPGSGARLERALRVARFVLADVTCRPVLRRRVGRERLRTIRHLPPEAGEELARCFGPPPEARRDDDASAKPGGAEGAARRPAAADETNQGGAVKAQVVRAHVPEDSRDRYLRAWSEWSGTLFPMGIDSELLESEEEDGRFVEITWFEEGDEAAVGDDRLTRANAEMNAAAERREGDLHFFREVEPKPV